MLRHQSIRVDLQAITFATSAVLAPGQRSAETDDFGKASFVELKAGSYRLDAEGDGYLSQHQQHLPGIVAGGILVNVSSGEKTNARSG